MALKITVMAGAFNNITRSFVALALLAGAGNWQARAAEPAAPQALASINELMTRVVQPTSDAVFYVSRTPPQSDEDWRVLENQTLMLAESANLLLIQGYVRDTEQWLTDSLLMRNAAEAAYQAAKSKDLPTLEDLNNALYESCESCHNATR